MVYGEGNLKRLKMVGQYQVGHRDFNLNTSGITCSVYYPMDKHIYKQNIKKEGRNSKWLRHGEDSLTGISRATADYGAEEAPPRFLFKYLLDVKMDTC